MNTIKKQMQFYQSNFPAAPFIIVVTENQFMRNPLTLQSAERMGLKMIDRKRGGKLAGEIRAVKYFECSSVSWRGYKI